MLFYVVSPDSAGEAVCTFKLIRNETYAGRSNIFANLMTSHTLEHYLFTCKYV